MKRRQSAKCEAVGAKRIVIVDDHPLFRKGLKQLINNRAAWCKRGDRAAASSRGGCCGPADPRTYPFGKTVTYVNVVDEFCNYVTAKVLRRVLSQISSERTISSQLAESLTTSFVGKWLSTFGCLPSENLSHKIHD